MLRTNSLCLLQLALLLVLGSLFAGCDDSAGSKGEVGDPCSNDGNCVGGLVCDETTSTCQPADSDFRNLPDADDMSDQDEDADMVEDVPDTEDGDVDADTPAECEDGESRPCGSNIGECETGTQECVAGEWSECSGVNPAEEICDGLDNDCNGVPDSTDSGPLQESCGIDQPPCSAGVRTCVDGVWGACKGEIPPTEEVCDSVDNDCDGTPDGPNATDARTWYADTDGDGFGDPNNSVQSCGVPNMGTWVEDNTDCNDDENSVNPTGTEVCDGLDNDCANGPDDNLARSCYGGPAGTAGEGLCTAGTQTCTAGVWGACQGEVTPAPEVCDGQDNDCDTIADNFTESCYGGPMNTAGVGQCQAGSRLCTNGSWGACVGEVLPETEVCDGSNNDCDMELDEGCTCTNGDTQPCYNGPAGTAGVGQCQQGTQTCTNGAWGSCVGEVTPTAEICDGLDNNCVNGPDENLVRSCYGGPAGTEGVGVCQSGSETCTNGAWGVCAGQVTPSPDVCDNQDNDCDPGTADGSGEAWFGNNCDGMDTDLCQEGTFQCTNGVQACSDNSPDTLDYCDGMDNDCNPATDDGAAEPWFGNSCDGFDTDLCQEGSFQCSGGLQFCSDNTTSNIDVCDGIDNDCNPATPDGQAEAWFGSACDGPDSDQCLEGTFDCTAGMQTCDDNTAGSPDICDGLNNDCDSSTADGSAESWFMDPCDGADTDLCVEGNEVCSAGTRTCSDMTSDDVEICNMADDDCNGLIDDTAGCCQTSVDNDFDGSNQCDDCDDTNGAVYPMAPELCDGLDNDCDNLIDEDFDGDGDTYTTCTMDPNLFDCDDSNGAINPGAMEDCGASGNGNGVDENCNGYVDEGCGNCDMNDTDGDGVSECMGDCDPGDGDVYPGANEVCDGKDNDCNTLTVENCEVGDPCNFASGTDVCESDLLCACVVNASGSCTGDYLCTAFCNTSQTGTLGDGCAADETCLYDLLRTANVHGCGVLTGASPGSLQGGENCSQDSDCRSNSCVKPCVGQGCNQKICQDFCGSDDYCDAPGTVCRLRRLSDNIDGVCWPDGGPFLGNSSIGQGCFGDSSCDRGFCNGTEGECTEACCKDTDCPSGYHCGLTGDQIDTSFAYPPPNAPSCTGGCPSGMVCITATDQCAWRLTETSPMCIPDDSGQGTRQAGAACTNNSDCRSNFCDRNLNVCVEPCCSDAACPAGLSCELQNVYTHSDRVTQSRLCVSVSTDEVLRRQ